MKTAREWLHNFSFGGDTKEDFQRFVSEVQQDALSSAADLGKMNESLAEGNRYLKDKLDAANQLYKLTLANEERWMQKHSAAESALAKAEQSLKLAERFIDAIDVSSFHRDFNQMKYDFLESRQPPLPASGKGEE
jgi:uncharacterized damage-inducible protein DinB